MRYIKKDMGTKDPKLEKYDMIIGSRLKAFRVQAGLTLQQASDKLTDMGYHCYTKKLFLIEHGSIPFHFHTFLIKACKLYIKTPNDVYGVRIVRHM